ncbi:enteropeptidase [Aulostomus maculatus]
MRCRLSSLELLLVLVCLLLLLCCVGLMVVSWITLQPEDGTEPAALSGTMLITEGCIFSNELKNTSSLQFKSLAFDVQHLVWEALIRSELRLQFKSCQVLQFRPGGVLVIFDLWFNQLVDVKEAEQQLRSWFQDNRGLVVDKETIRITVACPPHQSPCAKEMVCVPIDRICDGVDDCPDGSDEDVAHCATPCDGQFLLRGPVGSFSSSDESDTINSIRFCRWIIRVQTGFSVQIHFQHFNMEQNCNVLRLYEGVGPERQQIGLNPQSHQSHSPEPGTGPGPAELSGSTPPGTVWLLTDQSTVEFSSDDVISLTTKFKATYSAGNLSTLSNEEKLNCTFEDGFCFWRQQQDDDGDWIRTSGPTFPPFSGPSIDHTQGNLSGFYIISPLSPGQWLKSFRIHSLPLTPPTQPMCLHFWYHMFGEDVHRLRVLLVQMSPSHTHPTVTMVFQRDGNYGDNWNYGQVSLNLTAETMVVFEALKKGGIRNDIALDDITLTSESCGPAPPEPTNMPAPTTAPPLPADCGGPFELWEPNSTFSSPNYPQSYQNKANCVWILLALQGRNIQLHFLDFDVEATYDVVEVRDGVEPNSTLLAVLTGSNGPAHDLFSKTNRVTVWFFTDSSGNGRGFRANFTSGVDLGTPAPCEAAQFQCHTGSCVHSNSQCDGVVDCPDASDEADCVLLQVNGSRLLQFQLISSLFTVCADTWTLHLSVFTCRYLGHRSGEASLLPLLPHYSPFTNITVTSNGTLETSVSETCATDLVVSLTCDNQPCGIRYVINTTEVNQSADSQDQARVVGGADAVKGAWPWMVSLHWRGRHVCGASVLDNDWLLTAAHCVYGKNIHLQSWTVKLGLHSQSDSNSFDVQTRQVDCIVINSGYNRRTKDADIAMIHLQQPINLTDLIQPICLPSHHQKFASGKCFIAGWGRDTEGALPDVLQEAQVPLVLQDQCQRQLPEYTITSNMLCAGYLEGGVDSCQGDSGGPLMCLETGRWTLIGVTSFGIGCGKPARPGVYTRVSSFIPWITETRRSSSSHWMS